MLRHITSLVRNFKQHGAALEPENFQRSSYNQRAGSTHCLIHLQERTGRSISPEMTN